MPEQLPQPSLPNRVFIETLRVREGPQGNYSAYNALLNISAIAIGFGSYQAINHTIFSEHVAYNNTEHTVKEQVAPLSEDVASIDSQQQVLKSLNVQDPGLLKKLATKEQRLRTAITTEKAKLPAHDPQGQAELISGGGGVIFGVLAYVAIDKITNARVRSLRKRGIIS